MLFGFRPLKNVSLWIYRKANRECGCCRERVSASTNIYEEKKKDARAKDQRRYAGQHKEGVWARSVLRASTTYLILISVLFFFLFFLYPLDFNSDFLDSLRSFKSISSDLLFWKGSILSLQWDQNFVHPISVQKVRLFCRRKVKFTKFLINYHFIHKICQLWSCFRRVKWRFECDISIQSPSIQLRPGVNGSSNRVFL